MKKKNKKFGFLILLIPLGILIRYIDRKVTQDGFLSTNAISDHYLFISGLVAVVIVLLSVILYFDKKSNP
tara:strand:+ start:481 stop:690 length:210 start_codon:yes stop_codon:yes gene_type:complete